MKKYILPCLLFAGMLVSAANVGAQTSLSQLAAARGDALGSPAVEIIAKAAPSSFLERMDINGDGYPERVSLSENSQGEAIGLKIVDTAKKSTMLSLAEHQVAELFGVGKLRVLGFLDVDGDGTKELSILKRSSTAGSAKAAGANRVYADFTAFRHEMTHPHNDSLFVLQLALQGAEQLPVIKQTFPERTKTAEAGTGIRQLSSFGLFDLDNDGRLDLILGDEQAGVTEVWRSPATMHESGDQLLPESGLPAADAHLFQNYPNPFSEHTSIAYQVTENDLVQIRIYDMLGREVRTLVNTSRSPGAYTVSWDGRDEAGVAVTAGVYLYKLQVGETSVSRQMLRIK